MKKSETVIWIRRHPLATTVVLLVVVDVIVAVTAYSSHHSYLRVSFLDVGQGDAVLIQAPNGNQLLYDAGPPSGASLRALAREMPFFDHSIDVAVLSHPDQDHIGGFPEIFKRYDIGAVLEPGATSENGVYDATEMAIVAEHAGRILARKGMSIELGDGVVADILYPDHDMAGSETNSASIVLRIRYGTTAFLLSGDLPQSQEEYVVKEFGEGLHSQVLKLGHHGSRTSSSAYWLAAVHPDTAVISAGLDNRYGHPHKEVIELLAKLGIHALKTYEEGTISFQSDGETVTRD